MRSQIHTSVPPWRRRPRSRIRSTRVHPCHNPAHPSAARHHRHPRPSTILTEDVKQDIDCLRQDAKWGEKMRPTDPDWVADSHNRAVQIQKQLLGQPPQMLMNKMPRNPETWHVEVGMDGNDAEKKNLMKLLLNCHVGEVRETYGYWHLVLAQLPESGAWYSSQYPKHRPTCQPQLPSTRT